MNFALRKARGGKSVTAITLGNEVSQNWTNEAVLNLGGISFIRSPLDHGHDKAYWVTY